MKTKFLVAEDIRPEQTGKVTLLGLFPDDVIVVGDDRPEGVEAGARPAMPKICFLVTVLDMPTGDYELKASLSSPSGQPLIAADTPMGKLTGHDTKTHNILIQLAPFVVLEFGTHTLLVNINGEEHRFPFEVRARTPSVDKIAAAT